MTKEWAANKIAEYAPEGSNDSVRAMAELGRAIYQIESWEKFKAKYKGDSKDIYEVNRNALLSVLTAMEYSLSIYEAEEGILGDVDARLVDKLTTSAKKVAAKNERS